MRDICPALNSSELLSGIGTLIVGIGTTDDPGVGKAIGSVLRDDVFADVEVLLQLLNG